MADTAISSLLELLGEHLIHKVKSLRGVEGKVEWLKVELRRMQSSLEFANGKQFEIPNVRNWVSEIRELALDAQDTIEIFLLNVEIHKNRGSLRSCISFPKRIYHLETIEGEIDSICKRLEEIRKSRKTYGIPDLQEAVAAGSTQISQVELRRRLPPWRKDEQLVGVEGDVEKLLGEWVLNEEKKGLSFAIIWGMGGIGKTALAREIYNRHDVAGSFECCAWAVVSNEFNASETIEKLIKDLTGSNKQKVRDFQESTRELYQLLQGKRYLIVLDDVWNKQQWECLRNAFPNEQDKASKLLVTTRNKFMIEHDQYEYEMKALDSEKSWELLLKKASINGKCPEELESIGRQIVEKCCGLPLAISVVGGILMETRKKSGWERHLSQINSYLGGKESDVRPILELSYQNLSPHLKPCFLCLAFFEEDRYIRAQELIDIWASQGLIKQEGSSTIDEIGRGYLDELINKSLLQIEDLTIDDRVEICRLHDLLRERCINIAKEEMGFADSDDGSSFKNRHRLVHVKEHITTFSQKQKRHFRSLVIYNVNDVDMSFPSRYWKGFELLKTLDIQGFEFQTLPRSFRFLLGLKYLRIIYRKVLRLPSWFDHLKKLEVFEVVDVELPDVPLKMESLRHFHAFSIYSRAMNIENWKNIEILRGIELWDLPEISSTIMANSHLRELGIHVVGREEADVISRAIASLQKMTNLVKLHIQSAPAFCWLSELQLDASVFPPNLSHLMLVASFDEDPMEELGKLPNLMYLELQDAWEAKGIDWRMRVSQDGFPCLEAFYLDGMKDLRGIDIEEGGMPRLKQLRIRYCPKLETQNLPKHIIIISS